MLSSVSSFWNKVFLSPKGLLWIQFLHEPPTQIHWIIYEENSALGVLRGGKCVSQDLGHAAFLSQLFHQLCGQTWAHHSVSSGPSFFIFNSRNLEKKCKVPDNSKI